MIIEEVEMKEFNHKHEDEHEEEGEWEVAINNVEITITIVGFEKDSTKGEREGRKRLIIIRNGILQVLKEMMRQS